MQNKIYISEYLKSTYRGKSIFDELKNLEKKSKLIVSEIPNNKNEWCRDYMPVKGANNQLVLFKYRPSYLVGSKTYEKTIPNQEIILKNMHLPYAPLMDVTMDGGAIELFDKKGIITDRVISENSSKWVDSKPEIVEKIKNALGLDLLIVVPSDPSDFTGHVDGMVRFVDAHHVLINDMTGVDQRLHEFSQYEQDRYTQWKNNLIETLQNSGFIISTLTCAMHKNKNPDAATGIYLNFLNLDDILLMPAFSGLESENKEAMIQLKQIFKKEVFPIQLDKVAEKGGAMNCITWNP